MNNTLLIAQIAVSILLVIVVLFQQRGTALGSAFGGGSGEVYSTRRGFQKNLLWATIVLTIAFIALAVLNLAN
ncbi:MAG: preprotein translocase subunit SecG [Candidatus Pacebacteria bacterium]|nr:preprotein translocase subunit SecG [Candidatus Paceibacterota bacterium]